MTTSNALVESTAVFVPYRNGASTAGSPHTGTADAMCDAALVCEPFDA